MKMTGDFDFIKASRNDADEIFSLYRSVTGTSFCLWDESYPALDEIYADLDAETLYILKDKNRIAGSASIAPLNELDEIGVWKYSDAREIARVAVLPEYQGNSYALGMVYALEDIIRTEGYSSVHLLAAKKNIPAFRTYLKAGYENRGNVFMFGIDFYAMEKSISLHD